MSCYSFLADLVSSPFPSLKFQTYFSQSIEKRLVQLTTVMEQTTPGLCHPLLL